MIVVHLGSSYQVNCAVFFDSLLESLEWGIWEWIKRTLDCSYQASVAILIRVFRKE